MRASNRKTHIPLRAEIIAPVIIIIYIAYLDYSNQTLHGFSVIVSSKNGPYQAAVIFSASLNSLQ